MLPIKFYSSTKKQRRQLSESSGSYSRSSASYSRSATPDSTFSSDDSRSRSLTPTRSVSRSSSYSSSPRSRSRSPNYSSLKIHHSHKSKQQRRHRHDREKEKSGTKHRHRHKTKRHDTSAQPKAKAVKRLRKHRSRSRSPARKKHRLENTLLSPDLNSAATTPEMVDPDTQLLMKSHRHKHKRKEKRRHRHRRRTEEEEDGRENIMDQIGEQDNTELDTMIENDSKESGSVAEGQLESESVSVQSSELTKDEIESMETVTAESANTTHDGEDHMLQEDKDEISTSSKDGAPSSSIKLPVAKDTATKADLVPYHQDSLATETEHQSDALQATENSVVTQEQQRQPSPPATSEVREDDDALLDDGDESMMIQVHAEEPLDECSAELLDSECTQPESTHPGQSK